MRADRRPGPDAGRWDPRAGGRGRCARRPADATPWVGWSSCCGSPSRTIRPRRRRAARARWRGSSARPRRRPARPARAPGGRTRAGSTSTRRRRRRRAVPDRSAASTSALSASTVARRVGRRLAALRLLADADRLTPSSSAAFATSSSTLPMTLWLLATTPTRRPSPTSRTIIRAPVYVLPEPGRALDREHAAGHRPDHADRGVDGRLARPPDRPAGCLAGVGRRPEQRAPGPTPGRRVPVDARARRPGARSAAGSRPAPCSARRPRGRSSGAAAIAARTSPPRLIVIVRATSSTSITLARRLRRSADPSTSLSSPIRWSWGGERERVARSTA